MSAKRPFLGAFVMRSHDHQILTTTYFNTDTTEPYPETAKRVAAGSEPEDPFVGSFKATWLQADGSYEVDLTITRARGSSLYRLLWSGKSGVEFQGEAVKEKDFIFGYYW